MMSEGTQERHSQGEHGADHSTRLLPVLNSRRKLTPVCRDILIVLRILLILLPGFFPAYLFPRDILLILLPDFLPSYLFPRDILLILLPSDRTGG